MGQNFLIDKNIADKLVKNVNKKDLILEIGPGLGIITERLSQAAKKVVAVEKDRNNVEVLKQQKYPHVEIIEGDILKVLKEKNFSNYRVVANIPFYLTSHLIRMLLEGEGQPKDIVLLVQKELAQRICSTPPDMNLLAVSVQYYSEPKILSFVSKNCFWPRPKVDSAIIQITPKQKYSKKDIDFFRIVKSGFISPRKKLLNNLSIGLKIPKEKLSQKTKIDLDRRAETLTIDDWKILLKDL